MIDVQGLTKTYGKRIAIDGLTFHAKQGEILGFLGPNGAGKTTTMRILTGYMPPTAGTARIAGYDVVDDSLEVRKRVGYLPETVPLYQDMSVLDYLIFMGKLRKVPKVEERAWEVLEQVGMAERAASFIGSLSKGMRQRVGLAQAIIHKPEVLILDEPTIGLDPAQVVEVRELIKEIGKEHTVVLSTHILAEAQQLCDRVLIINQGKIVAEDTPEALQLRLQGGRRIILEANGKPLDALKEQLAHLPGVRGINVLPTSNRMEILVEEDKELRPLVARTVLENGYDLLEIRLAEMSLEDIFLQLVKEQEPTPAETTSADEAPTPEHPSSDAEAQPLAASQDSANEEG